MVVELFLTISFWCIPVDDYRDDIVVLKIPFPFSKSKLFSAARIESLDCVLVFSGFFCILNSNNEIIKRLGRSIAYL